MRNTNTNSSIANELRFSAQATVTLRGKGMLPLDTWRPICAGSFDDFGLYPKPGNYRVKPSTGAALEPEQIDERSIQIDVQHLTPSASILFHSLS